MASSSATSYRLQLEGLGGPDTCIPPFSHWKLRKMLGHDGQIVGNRVYGVGSTVGEYVILCVRTNETSIVKGQQCPSILLWWFRSDCAIAAVVSY